MATLVGKKAPDFTAAAVKGDGEIVTDFNLYSEIRNKYALVFFYPLDFTFVCPSEIIAIHNHMDEFKKRGVEVIGVSIDSQFTHHAWRNTPVDKGGIGKVAYTLVADVNHAICQAYGVEHPEAGVAFRGTFIIDTNGVVRSEIINDLPIGRNVDELLRLFDAVQFHEEHGEVCPAGWQQGKAGMKPSPEGVATYPTDHSDEL